MVKTIRHLELNPTFEKLIQNGETWDFPIDLQIYGRAAINFRNSHFGSQLDPVGSVVSEGHDAAVEKVLAGMKVFAEQQDRTREARREDNRRMYAENLPTGNTEAEHVHPETAAPPPSPTHTGSLGARGSAPTFLERMEERRKENPQREANDFASRKDINRARQEARQAVDRNRVLNHKRRDTVAANNHARAQAFTIDTPPASRSPSPQPGMQDKYDQRLLRANAVRNPRVSKVHAASSSRDVLSEKRQSATQIANKRPLPPDRSTLRKKKRTEAGDRGRQRNN